MFHNADLLLVSCLVLAVESQTGKILPPQDLSLTWINHFKPNLSWTPPLPSMQGCDFIVNIKADIPYSKETPETTWTDLVVMDGGFLGLSVTTNCNNTQSEPAFRNVTFPKLVENWECYIYSENWSNCTWKPASDARDVRFFYRLVTEGQGPNYSTSIQECPSYSFHNNVRRGCQLQTNYLQRIYISFIETRNNTPLWNTYQMGLQRNVKPPPLNWTVIKTGNKFDISWSPPDIPNAEWRYFINYTECKETTTIDVPTTSYQLDRVPHCPYYIAIKAKQDNGETPWSETRYFGADQNASLYAAIIIPLVFAGLAALIFVCCRRNKDAIFPKVPQPRDLLSDISDNNNKSTVCNLYVPAKEEENCKITLVIDPQLNKANY